MVTAHRNNALATLYREINDRWPDRDRTSDGWIGDSAHQATRSDHNPDPDGTVDAIDVDVDGIDVDELLDAACAHESTQYVIYNRSITSRNYDGGLGVWHPYYGPNPHDKHIHVNTRESHEDSLKPWFIETETVPEKMYILAREEDKPEVFIGDFITRRHIETEEELGHVRWWLRHKGYDATVHLFRPGTIGVLGKLTS